MTKCQRCGDDLRWRLGFFPSVVAIDPVVAPIFTCLFCPEVTASRLEPEAGARFIAEWDVDALGGAG
jgi:hypothetical protein